MAGQGASIGPYLIGNLFNARDLTAIRKAFGIDAPIPDSNPLGTWNIEEETRAGYLSAKFNGGALPLNGIVGLRIVNTGEALNGYQILTGANTVTPIAVASSYTDLLPSLNLRYRLTEALQLRLGASRTITRPDFNQLSPSLVLTPNTINPSQNTGVAGNPRLTPVRSVNVDGSVEYYFNKNTSVTMAGFWKKVEGFVANAGNEETYYGQTYLVTRPYNSNTADIKGFEFNYQQFYDFLPGWLGGLGLQANYTYIDSETLIDALGQSGPLQNLSENSYNLISLYDKDDVSIRVAYNWRDTFLSGTANIVGVGALPIYTDAYGWLDASAIYRVNQHLSIALEGLNLLGTVRNAYYGAQTRPQSAWVNDTQVAASVTFRF